MYDLFHSHYFTCMYDLFHSRVGEYLLLGVNFGYCDGTGDVIYFTSNHFNLGIISVLLPIDRLKSHYELRISL